MTSRALPFAVAAAVLLAASPTGAGAHGSRCAAREPQPVKPVAGGPPQLVPSGATALRLCRYRGLNPAATALRLRSSRVVTNNAEVASTALALNRLPREQAVIHCPMDNGSAILASFSYAHSPAVVLHIGLSGCVTVTGAYLPARTAAGPAGARLVGRLEQLAA
jgi:hypothetical protein